MAIKDYQVTFDANGDVAQVKEIALSESEPRVIRVRAASVNKAVRAAEGLFSLAVGRSG